MAADPGPVSRALSASLSNSAPTRRSAEALLARLAAQHEHAAELLRLAAGSDPVVAPAAALRLKNLMRASRTQPTLSEPARALVRTHVLPALSAVQGTNTEAVLAETTRWLVLLDFPSKWPDLLPSISDYLASPDPSRVHAALIAMRQLVKCYEFKTRDPSKLVLSDPNDAGLAHPRQPLDSIASACFPTLLVLYDRLDAMVAERPDINHRQRNACRAQRLIVKIFWSCTQFILPPCLGEPGVLDEWMARFFVTIRRPSQLPFIDDPCDLAYEPEWKTKKWIAQVLTRFLKRYGSPKKVPLDEPWAKEVAEAFKERHAVHATNVMLEVLSSETKGKQLSLRVAHLALDYIEEAIETAVLWNVVRPHVDTLLTRVVFPYLCFSDADLETWTQDPGEYVRKQYDFTEDFTSPRMAAANLLTKMSDLRSKSTILPFLQYILQSVLEPFAASPPGSSQRAALARQKVGAFASLAAVKVKLISKKDLAVSFLTTLKSHVEPDLGSEFGFLRSESAWLLGQVASCVWDDFAAALGESSLRGCVRLLQDPEIPVQATAAGALQFLMDQEGAVPLISPVAPQLLERLLALMDNMSDGYQSMLPALDKLVSRYPDEIMPLAVPMVQRLMAAFKQSAQGILEDDEDDELAFTAAQVLHLISSIITSVGEWSKPTASEKSAVFRSLEMELQPLLNSMFEESHQVFVEELLDVLGTLVLQTGELNSGLSPFLISLIPKMVNGFNVWAADYVEHMLEAIEGYLMFDIRAILALEGGIQAFMGMVLKLWSKKFDDSDALYGAKIADQIILSLCKLRPLPESLTLQIVVELARNAAGRCVSTAEDQMMLRQRLFSVVMLCLYLDATSVLTALGPQSVMQLIGSQTNDVQLFDRVYSKKSVILGIGSILCTKGLIRDESKPLLLGLALKLQRLIDQQRQLSARNISQNLSSYEAAMNKMEKNAFDGAAEDDGGSDLEDDQDAHNFLEELGNADKNQLERLAADTGISVDTLEQWNSNGGLLMEGGLLDMDGLEDEDDDEGGYGGNAMDAINEVEFLVCSVKESVGEPWWGSVGAEDRMGIEQLASRTAMGAH